MGSAGYAENSFGKYARMASVTPSDLLKQLAFVCANSDFVSTYTVIVNDEKTLVVRVYLTNETWINAFYNVVTGGVSFAWFRGRQRLYGKDNSKRIWHVHPFNATRIHQPCDPVDFETFLREVENLYPHAYEGN